MTGKRMRIRTGISRAADAGELPRLAAAARACGFAGVQFKEGQYRQALADAPGFRAAYGDLAPGGLIAYPRGEPAGWLEALRPVFPFARQIGAEHICVCACHKDPARPKSEQYPAAARMLTAIGTEARSFGVTVSLHNHAGSLWESLEDLAGIVALLDPAQVGLTLDTGHCHKGGIDDIPAAIRRFLPFLINVHIKDVDAAGNFCPLGEGLLALAPVLRTLEEVGYRHWLIVDEESKDVPVEEAFAIARAFLDKHGF